MQDTEHSIGPSIDPPSASMREDCRVLEPLLYGDVFEYPLTLEEIWEYCPRAMTREQVAAGLHPEGNGSHIPSIIGNSKGYYFLRGRQALVSRRTECGNASERLWKRAFRVASFLQCVPFLRSMAVTGSLATNNAGIDGDPDFLIITAENRIWTVFFILGTIQKMTSTKFLCPNFYLSENHLQITPRDFYNAREVLQSIPVYGMKVYRLFREINSWARDFCPNTPDSEGHPSLQLESRPVLMLVKRALERLTRGRIGDLLERVLRNLLRHRLLHHYREQGDEPPEQVIKNALLGRELRFHGLHHRAAIHQALKQRISMVEKTLAATSRES